MSDSEIISLRTTPSRHFSAPLEILRGPTKLESIAWKPIYSSISTTHYAAFGLGTVNGMAPTNWDMTFEISKDTFKFVFLKIRSTTNGVQSVELEVKSSPVVDNPYHEEWPPTDFNLLIGTLKAGKYLMAYSRPITIKPIEAFRVSKTAIGVGEEPFTRYWGWHALEEVAGPMGPMGPVGTAKGDKGDQGDQGDVGPPGPRGPAGS